MRREVWFGRVLWALAAPVVAEEVPGCGELALVDCLGVPPPGLEFPDREPLAQPSLERPRGLDDPRWRTELERGLERGEFPPARARIELAWLAVRRDEAGRAQALIEQAAAEGKPVSLSTHLYIDVRGRPADKGGHVFEIQYTGAGLG